MDVQSALVNEDNLLHFEENELRNEVKIFASQEDVHSVHQMLLSTKRPVIIMGQGVRLSHSVIEFRKFIEHYKIPVVSPFL
jgi:acetolactate synthase I/II/III large subunit